MSQNIFNVKTLTAVTSGIMAIMSFIISYSAMSKLSATWGIEPHQIFPLIIDGILLLALIWRLTEINTMYAQLTMLTYVMTSVALNFYAHNTIQGGLIAMIAPISLFVSSEICASILHHKSSTNHPKKSTLKKSTPKNCPLRDEHGRFIKNTQ